MTNTQILLTLSVLVYCFGLVVYLRDTLRGKNAPNRMTFLIWAAGPMIAVAAGVASGEAWSLIPVFLAGFGPALIFFASFINPKAYWKLHALDYVCGALAIFALIAWRVTSDPNVAIVFAIIADGFAGLPTIIKAWKFPETETGFGYLTAWISSNIGLLAAPDYSFASVGFLIYLFFLNGSLIFSIYRKRAISCLTGNSPV